MPVKHLTCLALMVLVLATAVIALGQTESSDPWEPVRALEGVWTGEGEGFGQTSRLTHKWEFVLDDKFLRLQTESVTTTETGEDELHQDVGYVSWSEGEGVLRFRQFLSEGFVNTFIVEKASASNPGLNFEPESTEGMDKMSVRMTLRFLDAETYEMVLELGTKGKKLTPCQTMKLRKAN